MDALATTDAVLVGRATEVERIREALAVALAGAGGLVLITGEAGMGKSRLAEQIAADARAASADVLWGRCWEAGGEPALWPWVEVIRGWARERAPGAVEATAGPGAERLARLVPDLLPAVGRRAGLVASEDASDRFALFDAVAGFLARAARERPLAIVLDDLHAADQASLLLLRFCASALRAAPVLLVGAWRDAEPGLSSQSRDLLADLTGDGLHVPVRGLTVEAVRQLAAAEGRFKPSASAAADLREATDGNPLFVTEVVRLLAAEGRLVEGQDRLPRPLPIPSRLRAVIARRLRMLPEPTARALTVAAAIGREFPLATLSQVEGVGAPDALAMLDPAVKIRLVELAPSAPGRLRFSHALVRDAIYSEIEPSERARLHRAVADAIERSIRGDDDEGLSELAHHLLQAATDRETAARGASYAERAAARAHHLLAFEEAASLYRAALLAADFSEPGHGERCRVLLRLGGVQWRSGDGAGARATFARASHEAGRAGDSEALARAALGFGEIGVAASRVDAELVALLERALAALPECDSALRARLLGRLARELHFAGMPERRADLSREAVEMARRLDDPSTLAATLGAWHVAEWAPGNPEERLAVATQVLELAERIDDRDLAFQAHMWRAADLLALGDLRAVDVEIVACDRLARSLHQPAWTAQVALLQAMRALVDGRFELAARRTTDALELGRGPRGDTAAVYFLVQELARRREQGGLDELEPEVRARADEDPERWLADHAYVLAELGLEEQCRTALERLAAADFGGAEQDIVTLLRLTQIAEAACFVGSRAHAAVIYERLRPHASRWIVSGIAGACYGCAARPLGRLAHTLGRFDEAEAHFETAIRAHRDAGAHPWLAHTRHDYARLLLARAGPTDAALASELLAESRSAACALGMGPLLARLENVEQATRVELPVDVPAGRRVRLRREGEYWTIEWDARVIRVRDAKGMRHLARLLAQPHVEVSAVDLIREAPRADQSAGALIADGLVVRSAAQDDAGEMVDEQARRAYRERARELQEELELARSFNDPARAELARVELEFLAAELSRAVGLGGRARRAASTGERARLNATRALRTAIDRIAVLDADLGQHLADAVKTGAACRYAPPPGDQINWDLEG